MCVSFGNRNVNRTKMNVFLLSLPAADIKQLALCLFLKTTYQILMGMC